MAFYHHWNTASDHNKVGHYHRDGTEDWVITIGQNGGSDIIRRNGVDVGSSAVVWVISPL